jgi:choline dehydrogenase-like flavoprotein
LGGPLDWAFTTQPQRGLNNRSLSIPRGRVLGGSSAVNLLAWNRASAAEYDAWESLGNPGWNWKTLSAAMEKAETYVNGPPGSGTHGPIKAVISRFMTEHQKAFVPAVARHFSYLPNNHDSLQGNPIGVMVQPSNIDPVPYNRSYSANAYLPLAGRNLEVLTDTPVAKVNLARPQDGDRNAPYTATGITLRNGTILTAHKGVVLSAGAIGSPVLLELSGIGKREVLRSAGITTLVDLPGVGENYQEHPRVHIAFALKEGQVSGDLLQVNETFRAEEWAKRLRGEPGFFDDVGANYIFTDWSGAVESRTVYGELTRLAKEVVDSAPEINKYELKKQLELLGDRRVPQVEVIYSGRYVGPKGYPAPTSKLYGRGFFSLLAGIQHPLSRGSVHVDPTDPVGKPPVLDPGLVSNKYDVAGLVALLKFCRRLAHAPGFREYWEVEYEPGEAVQTDEDWQAYIRNVTETIYHPTGTAAMRPRRDGGVVDAKLTVYGTTNLKVVDASIIPVQLSAHPQTAVYGIAERAAEIMIADGSTV